MATRPMVVIEGHGAPSESQAQAVIGVVAAIGSAIKQAGTQGIPSGQLYAYLMGKLDLDQYEQCLGVLKRGGVVEERYHVLYYAEEGALKKRRNMTLEQLTDMTAAEAKAAIEKMTLSEMVSAYNKISGSNVTKFSDKETGIRRLLGLRAGVEEKTVVADPTNEAERIPRAEPTQQTGAAPQGEDDMSKSNGTAKKARAKKSDDADSRIIRLLAEENPKRKGGASYLRFAKYKDGMTVEQALARGVTGADITYDSSHKFIKLEKA